MIVHFCAPSTLEVEVGGPRIQGYPELHKETFPPKGGNPQRTRCIGSLLTVERLGRNTGQGIHLGWFVR